MSPRPLNVRFHMSYEPEPNTGCWLWTCKLDRGGYGIIGQSFKGLRAHRVSWELHHGAIPSGMYVCHRCDVRACVNPAHLFLGTPKDNTQDCFIKGRGVPQSRRRNGERPRNLTPDEAREIRAACARGERQTDVARRHGITAHYVWLIAHKRAWGYLP